MKSSVSRPERMRSALTRVGADAVGAVIDRVLAHQQHGRGLGQSVGAEVRPRIDRLLRDVEQQASAGALRQHDLHRGLRHALMAEEIELEALAQCRVVDFADAALPCRAGVRDDDVDAAECIHHLLERRALTLSLVTSQAAASAVPPMAFAAFSAAARSMSSSATSAPAAANALAVAAPIAPPAPVTTATWPASGFSGALPSLACSIGQYSVSNMSASVIGRKRPIASASVMVETAASARSAAMRASLAERPKPVKTQARHQHDARQGIDHPFAAAGRACCGARNISCNSST